MAQFSKEIFDVLVINPYGKEDFVKEHRDKIKEIFGPPTKWRKNAYANTLKYVLYMYDHKTPMRDMYPEIGQRKLMCADLAGFEEPRKEMLSLNDDMTRDLVASLIRHQKNKIWAAYVSNEEVFWQYQEKLLAPIDLDDDKKFLDGLSVKGKLSKEIDEILSRIASYEEQLFGSDEDAKKMISPTSPEAMAKFLSNV